MVAQPWVYRTCVKSLVQLHLELNPNSPDYINLVHLITADVVLEAHKAMHELIDLLDLYAIDSVRPNWS